MIINWQFDYAFFNFAESKELKTTLPGEYVQAIFLTPWSINQKALPRLIYNSYI